MPQGEIISLVAGACGPVLGKMAHPLRKFRERLENAHTTIGNLTGGYAKCMRDMNRMPKHILDRMSTSLGNA